KKDDAPKEKGAEKPSKDPGLSIGKILWAGFLVVVIITLLSGYSSYLLYAERVDENLKIRQQATAERAGAVFVAKLELLIASIERTLNDEIIQDELKNIAADNIIPPEILQRRLSEQWDLLIRQAIVGPDTLPNDDITPALGYACLGLLSGKQPTLELHRFGTADQHLDIAFPIVNNKKLILSFDTKLTSQWLNTINITDGYIALQQQIGEHAPLIFERIGDHTLSASNNATIIAIPGTQFQVVVSLPVVEPITQLERILFFVNDGIALILMAFAFLATLITLRVILGKDLHTIISIVNKPQVCRHHMLPIKLTEVRKCAEKLMPRPEVDHDKNSEAEKEESNDKNKQSSPLVDTSSMVDSEPEEAKKSEPTDERK
ncbi:MAG: hypothetical protein GQ470_03710, partial [Gammaproteobacteria bacterium]|nr:hypothetical protein [Gammaproteobacteria bacterium]